MYLGVSSLVGPKLPEQPQEDARLFHLAMGTRRQPAASFRGPQGAAGGEGNIDMQGIQALREDHPQKIHGKSQNWMKMVGLFQGKSH